MNRRIWKVGGRDMTPSEIRLEKRLNRIALWLAIGVFFIFLD